jgi:transposase
MATIRDILRLKWVLGKSHREAAQSLGISAGAVGTVLTRARHAELTWEKAEALSDDELQARLYGPPRQPAKERPRPDPAWIHLERRRPGVTLELLHLEYLEKHPDGYSYTTFCDIYRTWLSKHRLSMRQVHRAGEKLFVDYSGKKPRIIDPRTGVVTEVELFVAVLGASNYTYVEATHTQQSRDFIASHIRALEHLGGVPGAIVPDQLKSGVVAACRYEPTTQRTYHELARHYGTAIIPARPGKPRDKAKAEVGVQVVQRWILARLRNEQFFSLEALNERIAELMDELNDRPMRRYGGVTRRALFEQLDRPALAPLPAERFVHATWKHATVNIDYHVEVEKHYYSVPYTKVHERVEVRLSAFTVEIFHKGVRVASHPRSVAAGRHTTDPQHMPSSHRQHLEWSPSRLIRWAQSMGPSVEALVSAILRDRPHPEQGYRSCLGILRLERRYGAERLEAACRRALRVGARSYRHVAAILDRGLDRMPLPGAEAEAESTPRMHGNVRGPGYYQ